MERFFVDFISLIVHLLSYHAHTKVIGNKWDTYLTLLHQEYSERFCWFCSILGSLLVTVYLLYRDALNELGLHRYCCRRMVLTHVDLIQKLLNYNSKLIVKCFLNFLPLRYCLFCVFIAMQPRTVIHQDA